MVHELEAENLQRRQKRSRPELLRGTTRRMETPLGTLYVTITEDDQGQPFEVFMTLGKAGGALMADVEAMGRLISLALRSGIPIKRDPPPAARHLLRPGHRARPEQGAVGAGCGRASRSSAGCRRSRASSRSCCRGAAASQAAGSRSPPSRVSYTVAGGEQMVLGGMQETLSGACPDCGSQLEFAEGCVKCHVCGFSECG